MKYLFLFSFTFSFYCVSAQSLAINTDGSTANSSAMLHVKSSNKGVLIPRMTKGEKNAIASPAEGLLIYQGAPDSVGFYYYKSGSWQLMADASANQPWMANGNTGTDAATNYIGTTDLEDLVFKTNATEAMRIDSIGKVGIGTTTPAHKLQVEGDIRFVGDFINQEAVGTSSGAVQAVPFTNGVFNPLNGTVDSITIIDGSGANNSAVFISGFARTFGGTLASTFASALGGYFLVLQRDVNRTFPAAVNVTYTSGSCFTSTPNGAAGVAIGFGGGGHVSFMETALAPGKYYYRLVLYPNGFNITSGTYDVYERSLSILQIKR
ncbi:MAG: hypothetical protein IPL84_02275 [Chitinophagaceae bacterium]|nr:hypothetical protein [Chitinophagaceae bacterium]